MLRAICVLCVVSTLPVAGASGPLAPLQARTARPPATRNSVDVLCPASLGKGVRSKRSFCDVVIGTDPAAGIVMRVPPHNGASTLRFDLHNRFSVSGKTLPYARISALAAVLNGNNGKLLGRAAVLGELRKELDLFDRIVGSGPGGTKNVAPGRAEAIKLAIPAAATSISIVGVRVEVTDISGRVAYTTPGRPVAIASNFRIEYTPATVKRQ